MINFDTAVKLNIYKTIAEITKAPTAEEMPTVLDRPLVEIGLTEPFWDPLSDRLNTTT